jgi:hypothetical protein
MVSRRDLDTGAGTSTTSGSSIIPGIDVKGLLSMIDNYASVGAQPVIELLGSQLSSSSTTPYSSISPAHVITTLIQSSLTTEQLVETFSAVLRGRDESDVVMLGEALGDIVQVLLDEAEDLEETKQNAMEVDTISPGDKGVAVLKALIVSRELVFLPAQLNPNPGIQRITLIHPEPRRISSYTPQAESTPYTTST